MWHEIHFNVSFGKWTLFEGTIDGYKITRFFRSRVTAKLYAKIYGYKFCKNA